ncbi:MAG: hypothetical protein JWN98_1359 [Abditibacteriota bacterium]|nr:hypothetical protein [Abditibacteriota bacterium]
MNSSVSIRPATPADAGTILELIRELAIYEKLLHEVEATEELLQKHLFDEPKARVLIAEYDGGAVGYALFFYNFSTFLGRPGIHLEDIFVQPQFRGRGIGKALLIQVAQIASQESCGRLEWNVLDWNEPSIAFYKSMGATPLEDWTIMRVTGDALTQLAQKSA